MKKNIPKRIILEDTGEHRIPRGLEFYMYNDETPFTHPYQVWNAEGYFDELDEADRVNLKPTDFTILRVVRNDFAKEHNTKRRKYPVGSIITGTHRVEDLIPAFITELSWHQPTKGTRTRMREIEHMATGERAASLARCTHYGDPLPAGHGGGSRHRMCTQCCPCDDCTLWRKKAYYATDDASRDLEWLEDELATLAGPYMYFGPHPGNTSDFGYWLCEDWEARLLSDQGVMVTDLSTVPPDHVGPVVLVDGSGHATLYMYTLDSRGHRYQSTEWEMV